VASFSCERRLNPDAGGGVPQCTASPAIGPASRCSTVLHSREDDAGGWGEDCLNCWAVLALFFSCVDINKALWGKGDETCA
jgi:hypothetical protein